LIRLGLAANWRQFSVLVLVNAFVGAMVGLERSILPALAEQEFHLAARAAILSFIAVFGVVKGLTNYFAGRLSDTLGRKPILVAGWLIAAPVPFLLMWAPSWSWILFANVLLGGSATGVYRLWRDLGYAVGISWDEWAGSPNRNPRRKRA
jgi:MFS family permease